MNPIVDSTLTGAMGILIAGLIFALFRGIFTVRDNTTAVKEVAGKLEALSGKVEKAVTDLNGKHDGLEGRVSSLEAWRLAQGK